MSDIFTFLVTVLVNNIDFRKVAVEIKSEYIVPDEVKYYRETRIREKLVKLLPLHIYNPKHDDSVLILDIIPIDSMSPFAKTKELQRVR